MVAAADPDVAEVLARQQELLRTECRADAARLRELLHPQFLEYGASGMTHTLQQVIDRLPAAPALDATASDFQAQRVAADVVLVTFRLRGTLASLRSSVWLRGADGAWRMRFHQGTPTQER